MAADARGSPRCSAFVNQSEAEFSFAAGPRLIVSVLQMSEAADKAVPLRVLGVVRFPVSEIGEFDIRNFEWWYAGVAEDRAENLHGERVS